MQNVAVHVYSRLCSASLLLSRSCRIALIAAQIAAFTLGVQTSISLTAFCLSRKALVSSFTKYHSPDIPKTTSDKQAGCVCPNTHVHSHTFTFALNSCFMGMMQRGVSVQTVGLKIEETII